MATFDYMALHAYDAGPTLEFIATDDDTGTASDGDADNTFESGDSFSGTFNDPTNGDAEFTVSIEYQGFIDFAGESLPLGFVPASALPGPPSLLQVAYPDGVYVVADFRDPTTITAPDPLDLSSLDSGPFVVCFLPGTAIATPGGACAVEALSIGDPVLTADGRTVPVKWIGRQTIATRFGPADRLMPVRIAADALGRGLPTRDLTLTADHALMLDGVLVNAGALVNGTTIARVPLSEFGERYTVYHVETEAHDIILAEGTETETFIDYAGRRAFDNHAEYAALYGEDRTIAEMPHPRVSSVRMLPASLKARLGIVAAA